LVILSSSDLAVFDQHHHGRGRKLFSHRTGLKDGLRLDRDLVLDISEAVALGQHRLPIRQNRE
jgi:hypothetical protein